MAVEESSHASPLPEAKPTAETTWLHSKAQVSIYLFLLGTWSVRYNDSAWSLYPSVLQIKVWSVPDHVATLSRSLQYLLRHSFKSSLETSKKKKKRHILSTTDCPFKKYYIYTTEWDPARLKLCWCHGIQSLEQRHKTSLTQWSKRFQSSMENHPFWLTSVEVLCWRNTQEGCVAPSLTFQIHGCHHDPITGHTWITVLSHQSVWAQKKQSAKWECSRISKSYGIAVWVFSYFRLLTLALQSAVGCPGQCCPPGYL